MVLSNLLGNAVKYSPDGGVIRAGGWAEDEYAVVYVVDQGIDRAGRSAAYLYRFTTCHATRKELASLHARSQAHGGTDAGRTQPGRGARFEPSLPLKRRTK